MLADVGRQGDEAALDIGDLRSLLDCARAMANHNPGSGFMHIEPVRQWGGRLPAPL